MASLYWFRKPESKTLRPVLGCISLDGCYFVLGGTPLPALYWLTDKVGCDNLPRKIPYYRLNQPTWSLSNNKVSSCR
jgi:hypothetical protein